MRVDIPLNKETKSKKKKEKERKQLYLQQSLHQMIILNQA